MTLLDYMPRGHGDSMEENSSLYILTLPSFVAIDIVVMDIYNYFDLPRDLAIPRDYMVMRLCR